MGTLLNRRRYMGGGGAPVPTDYIQDGLVFRLDGIDKGSTDGTWVDLIGGNVFTNNGATAFDTYFYFSNNGHMDGTRMECSNQYTVEACFAPDSSFSGMVFQTMTQASGKAMYLYLDQGLFLDRSAVYNLNNNVGNNTISLNVNLGVQNGQTISRGTKSDYWGNRGDFNIGYNSNSSGRFFFTGKIYAIRIYSKLLTQAEMLNNQRVDNTRFNLGLTI